jgi:hypothetical protein
MGNGSRSRAAIAAFVVLGQLLIVAPQLYAKLIEPKDPAGDPIRAAVRGFLSDLADGKEKEVRAQLADDAAGVKLVGKYLEAIGAEQSFLKSARKRFPDSNNFPVGPIEADIRGYMRAIDVEVIDVVGDTASMSPGSGFLLGVDLKQVGGQWKIASPTALHGKSEMFLQRKLDVIITALPALGEELEKGKIATEDELGQAVMDRVGKPLQALRKEENASRGR